MLLCGIQPSGKIHIGNYFGIIEPFLKNNSKKFMLIADLHAMTTRKLSDIHILRENMILDLIALGVDPKTIVIQSDFNQITFLSWILSTLISVQYIYRGHSYKHNTKKNIDINVATLFYPLLMSADVLSCNAETVLIGKDQKQHLEITRDLAVKLRNLGMKINIPTPLINKKTIIGIDGQKMSKSYNNCIYIFDNIKQQIYSIKTDSKTIEEPKDSESCLLFKTYQLFSNTKEINIIKKMYKDGGLSYKYMKDLVVNKILCFFEKSIKLRKEFQLSTFNKELLEGKNEFEIILKNNIKNIKTFIKY